MTGRCTHAPHSCQDQGWDGRPKEVGKEHARGGTTHHVRLHHNVGVDQVWRQGSDQLGGYKGGHRRLEVGGETRRKERLHARHVLGGYKWGHRRSEVGGWRGDEVEGAQTTRSTRALRPASEGDGTRVQSLGRTSARVKRRKRASLAESSRRVVNRVKPSATGRPSCTQPHIARGTRPRETTWIHNGKRKAGDGKGGGG
jgi:hypothetical protein